MAQLEVCTDTETHIFAVHCTLYRKPSEDCTVCRKPFEHCTLCRTPPVHCTLYRKPPVHCTLCSALNTSGNKD